MSGRGLRARVAALVGRMSPRERWLAVLLGLVVLAGAAFEANAWAGEQRDRALTAEADLALARQARVASASDALNGFDRAQLQALSEWSLKGGNIWIVRLKVEQQLAAAAAAAKVTDPDIQVAEAAERQGGFPVLKADIGGPYVKGNFVALLRQLYAGRQAALIDRVQVEAADQPQFKLTLLYPLDPRTPPQGPTAARP